MPPKTNGAEGLVPMGWLAQATRDGIPRRSAIVALIVGPILTVINQGDHVLRGDDINWWKVALTFLVPYVVATVGAVGVTRSPRQPRKGTEP